MQRTFAASALTTTTLTTTTLTTTTLTTMTLTTMVGAAVLAVSLTGCTAPPEPPATTAKPAIETDAPPATREKESPEETPKETPEETPKAKPQEKVVKSDEQWRAQLTEMQYYVTREKGTERAGSGEFAYHKKDGIYRCVCCEQELFDSKTKYESGTGWPSFYAPLVAEHVAEEADNTLFRKRTEVLCSRCDAHLGHLFPDGPQPTGLRYCLNSAALSFVPRDKAAEVAE